VLTQFFKAIGVEFLGPETVKRIYENGYKSLESVLDAGVSDFAKIDGMGEKSAQKIYKSVHSSLQNIKVSKLLAASGTLGGGIGEKKIISLLHKIPKILNTSWDKSVLVKKICEIKGFNVKTAEIIVKNLGMAKIFLNRIKKYATFFNPVPKLEEGTNNKFFEGKKVVFSGIRDKDLEEKIISSGGEVVTSVSKNTSIVVVKDSSETSGKIQRAKELGVKIVNIDDFRSEYF
jgi:NAD-dependent DNA ligase